MIFKKDNDERFNSVQNTDYFLKSLLKSKTSHILAAQVFCGCIISCLSIFSLKVFQGFKIVFVSLNFLRENLQRVCQIKSSIFAQQGLYCTLHSAYLEAFKQGVLYLFFIVTRNCPSFRRHWTWSLRRCWMCCLYCLSHWTWSLRRNYIWCPCNQGLRVDQLCVLCV